MELGRTRSHDAVSECLVRRNGVLFDEGRVNATSLQTR